MNENTQLRIESAIINNLSLCAVRAIMRTHPNPEALREAWNQEVAVMWAGASQTFSGVVPTAEQMVEFQRMFETAMERHLD